MLKYQIIEVIFSLGKVAISHSRLFWRKLIVRGIEVGEGEWNQIAQSYLSKVSKLGSSRTLGSRKRYWAQADVNGINFVQRACVNEMNKLIHIISLILFFYLLILIIL